MAFFYGGLVKGENVLNTMMMSIISMGVVALPWCLVGFSFAFDEGRRWARREGLLGGLSIRAPEEEPPEAAEPRITKDNSWSIGDARCASLLDPPPPPMHSTATAPSVVAPFKADDV